MKEEEGKAGPSGGELRRYLRSKLPEHMVPASYWRLDGMPLLASGKVNRKALAGSRGKALVEQEELAGPGHEVEGKLAEMWRELLGVGEGGGGEKFFRRGGH